MGTAAAGAVGWPAEVRGGCLLRGKKAENPPAAANAPEFRPQADLNRLSPPLVRPPLGIAQGRPLRICQGGRTSGRVFGRLRSACGRNSPASAAAGGDSFFATLADGRRELCQASQRPSQRRGPFIFEPTPPIGTNTITDKKSSRLQPTPFGQRTQERCAYSSSSCRTTSDSSPRRPNSSTATRRTRVPIRQKISYGIVPANSAIR